MQSMYIVLLMSPTSNVVKILIETRYHPCSLFLDHSVVRTMLGDVFFMLSFPRCLFIDRSKSSFVHVMNSKLGGLVWL